MSSPAIIKDNEGNLLPLGNVSKTFTYDATGSDNPNISFGSPWTTTRTVAEGLPSRIAPSLNVTTRLLGPDMATANISAIRSRVIGLEGNPTNIIFNFAEGDSPTTPLNGVQVVLRDAQPPRFDGNTTAQYEPIWYGTWGNTYKYRGADISVIWVKESNSLFLLEQENIVGAYRMTANDAGSIVRPKIVFYGDSSRSVGVSRVEFTAWYKLPR